MQKELVERDRYKAVVKLREVSETVKFETTIAIIFVDLSAMTEEASLIISSSVLPWNQPKRNSEKNK